MRYFLVILACVAFSGCDLDQAIARAESATKTAQIVAERAEATLKGAEQAVNVAKAAVTQAQVIADASGSEQAKKVVESARQALATAEAVLPSVKAAAADAKEALASAESSVAAAKATKEAGGSGWQILLAALGGFVPALLPIVKLAQSLSQARTAVKLTAAHADAMEAAVSDDDVAKAKAAAAQAQIAANVQTLIQSLRGK